MVILPNAPVKDAAGGKANKSLCLPRKLRSLFFWGYAQKNNPSEVDNSSGYQSYSRGYFLSMPSFFTKGYAGHVILNKISHLWKGTN